MAPSQLQKQTSRDISNNSRNARITPTNVRTVSPNQRIKTTMSQNQAYGFRQSTVEPQEQYQYNQFGESQILA